MCNLQLSAVPQNTEKMHQHRNNEQKNNPPHPLAGSVVCWEVFNPDFLALEMLMGSPEVAPLRNSTVIPGELKTAP